MISAAGFIDPRVHDGLQMRQADAGLLSLALMDARNRTLGWLAALEGLPAGTALDTLDPPWWLAGRVAWFQEHWITRHVQRGRGPRADPGSPRLAGSDPRADTWFGRDQGSIAQRWQLLPPPTVDLQAYLANALDTTLDLLQRAEPSDDALYFFRLALLHEDRIGEALAVLVQTLDLPAERHALLAERGLWPSLPSRGRRDPMALPGCTPAIGSAPGGCVPDAEHWAQPVAVPAFEIDAQPVNWAQFAEFVDDGGYDEPGWWSTGGWALLQAQARRVPRHVEQLAGGVLARRQGRLQRVPAAQPVLHVNAHEAAAWCRWAGRRLPSAAEWTVAAATASARGFVWGDLLEWVAGTAPALVQPGPAALDALPTEGPPWRVMCGASLWGSPRLRYPQARRHAPAERDEWFVGFRSCAV